MSYVIVIQAPGTPAAVYGPEKDFQVACEKMNKLVDAEDGLSGRVTHLNSMSAAQCIIDSADRPHMRLAA